MNLHARRKSSTDQIELVETHNISLSTHGAMNLKLQLAQETMKRLRSRRCVQRVVLLRLNVSEAKLLSETLMAAVRECDDTDTNRPTILLCDSIYRKLQKQIEREQQNGEFRRAEPEPQHKPVGESASPATNG